MALGLHALQHRGQEACGIVSFDGQQFHAHRALGQVDSTFAEGNDVLKNLSGSSAIGHNRYATSGSAELRDVQPLFADLSEGGMALAHNGNLTNAMILRQKMVQKGSIFQSTSDTEVILHLMAASQQSGFENRLIETLKMIEGAYSLIALTRSKLIGVRDPFGIRPLMMGKKDDGYILASESCALDIIGATWVRDIEPGEVVVIGHNGLKSYFPFAAQQQGHKGHFCIFEYVYFSRPDSVINQKSVYGVRHQIGMELAKEHVIDADIVVPIPDSGVPSALGYAKQSGLDFGYGIIRNHYVGRTFIEPTAKIRDFGVKLKHNANRAVIEGKRVILIDDSVVRGTTSKKIVEMVRNAGAKEVHLCIASPPTTHSCFFGVDTPTRQELLASSHSIESMCEWIGVDSLGFISLDGLYRAVGMEARPPSPQQRGFCDACFSGDYHIALADQEAANQLGRMPYQPSMLHDKSHVK